MKKMINLMISVLLVGGLTLSAHAAEGTNFTGTYKGPQQGTGRGAEGGTRPITREVILSVSGQLEIVATFYNPDNNFRDMGIAFDVKPTGDTLTFKMRDRGNNIAEYNLVLSGKVFNGKSSDVRTGRTFTMSLTRMDNMACPLDQRSQRISVPC